jgi:hypothetical protein
MLGANPSTALCLLDILEVAPEECGTYSVAAITLPSLPLYAHHNIYYLLCYVLMVSR